MPNETLLPRLQTMKREDAKVMVRQEFEDLMTIAFERAEELGLPKDQQFWSWDNAHANMTTEDAERLGRAGIRLPLPPWSPDMHRVIEHVMHTVKTGFAERLDYAAELPSPRQMQHMVQDIFYSIPKEHTKADCDTLPLTYESIRMPQGEKRPLNDKKGELLWLLEGVGGDWAPKALR